MANQIIVTQSGNVQVSIEPPSNVQVQISRAAIGTVSNVPTANFANFAGNVTASNQPNITSVGTLSNLSVSGNSTVNNLTVTGNLSAGNLVANNANFANFAGVANTANSVTLANVSGAGNIASINLDGNVSNVLSGNGSFVALPTVSANANFANFAGTAFNVSGSNVTGEVANAAYANAANTANLATFATTANAVAGANVSGTVANATFALDAGNSNLANTANSVALANVVGIGNIANINLDGSSSNVLFGNGVFAPESTSIANANYANFAGNLINGTSNITIPVANGNINVSTNGNANIATFDTNGALRLFPTTGSLNAIRIDSYGNPVANDVSRIASYRARGNATTPLSVNGSDRLMRFLAFGHNGTLPQTSSVATFNAVVDANYAPNTANIPIGWVLSVNDTSAGNNQNKNHQFYANGNILFANSVFVTDSFTSGGNITSNIGVFVGNGGGLSNIAVGNITGLGNIATLNLDGNASNVLLGNGVFSSVPVTIPTSIANGTSNISIPVANGNIVVSTNGNANVVDFRAEGSLGIRPPPQGPLNALRIETYGRSGNQGAQRISSFRYRGNVTTPSSVQAGDATMELLTAGYNGTILQTGSIARIQSIVDSSYTTGNTNIPLGWQLQVNDTSTGTNQLKTHNFYANGTTSLVGSLSANGNITGTDILSVTGNATTGNLTTGNITASGGSYTFSGGVGATVVNILGDKTTNSSFSLFDEQFSVTMSNVDTTTGFSPFRFQQYAPTSNQFGPMFFFRARGNDFFTQTPVVANDQVMSLNFLVNSNNATSSIGQFNATVASNDNAGNVGMTLDFNATGTGTTGYLDGAINLLANRTSSNNFTANTVSVGTGSNNITLNGTTGYITYNRTFGSFTSNATQTSAGANTVNYMTLNNTEDSNGVSIVSNSQITIARTGRYDIQFSAELAHDTNQTANVEIWLTKNGNAVANTNTILTLTKDEKAIAAWDWLVNANTANDYFQIAWASSDTNVEIIATDAANTIANVAAPSVIVTVIPVGA
jgi:hypothetical protein